MCSPRAASRRLAAVDGNHGFGPVKGDYAQMAPHCGAAMFHDIADASTMVHDAYEGGVPLFWAHARSHVDRRRAIELTMQFAPYWPVFGIGVLLAGPKGTAEPDDGLQVSEWASWRGGGAVKLWRELCEGNEDDPSRPRLPAAYVSRDAFCPIANASNIETILQATKRSVPRPTLEYAMALPWKAARHQTSHPTS